jgi:ubiquinone/menaquinone biosynthesis C-methylase UbiE
MAFKILPRAGSRMLRSPPAKSSIRSGITPPNQRTMTQSRQTLESIQSDFDSIALLSNEEWNHYANYHRSLIGQIPHQCRRILEIGCGTGTFSRLLAQRAEKVLAIDLSPQMIRIAQERSKLYPNIEFVTGDVMAYQIPDNRFDCIATLTTIHHLPIRTILKGIKKGLRPGGVFLCLDLYQRSSLTDFLFDGVAYSASVFLRLIKTGKPRPSRKLQEAYDEHGKTDTYLTLPQIEQICADLLPGALVSRHLFWRYSIIWKKET